MNEVIDSPLYFLSKIDVDNRQFVFIKTSREKLSTESFVDGRTSLSSEVDILLPFNDSLSSVVSGLKASDSRFIFHTAFCGSTFLARCLDLNGKSFAYKEPQVFIDLAEIKANNDELYQDKDKWRELIFFVLNQFNISFSENEINIIKPSNWVNTIALDLMLGSEGSKAILLSLKPQDFLVSVFRGGGERIQYVYSFLKHMVSGDCEYEGVLKRIEESPDSTALLFSKLSLLAYELQQKKFDEVSLRFSSNQTNLYNYDEVLLSPEGSIKDAAVFFGLDFTDADIASMVQKNEKRHSKVIERGYDISNKNEIDFKVLESYRKDFEQAMDWYRLSFN